MIYLDANADAEVLEPAWQAYMEACQVLGVPASEHADGRAARGALEAARSRIAEGLGAPSHRVIFTSGGTEADALALLGVLDGPGGEPDCTPHVITSTIEHAAIAATLERLAERGRVEVSWVQPSANGQLEVERVLEQLRPQTRLVSVVAASNETGALQPISELAAACRARGVFLHTDAVQAAGKLPERPGAWGSDLVSVSGHKLGAVGGVGALLLAPHVPLQPILAGDDREGGLRPGTENLAGILSLAAAVEHWPSAEDCARLQQMRDAFEQGLTARCPGAQIVGRTAPRLPNTSCVLVDGCEGDGLMMALDMRGIAVSTGSACSSGSIEPSTVLLGMGFTRAQARQSVRVSLGWNATQQHVDALIDAWVDVVEAIRTL